MENLRQIEGFFIDFSPEEMNDVREELDRRGYSADCAGIKDALLDYLFVEEESPEISDTERVISRARKFVSDNPATVKLGIDAIAGIARMVSRKGR